MATSYKGSQQVEATISLRELRGVKCQPKKCSGIIGGLKKLSNKYGEDVNVVESIGGTPTEPSARAVISFQHGPSDSDGPRDLKHFTSLPLGEEFLDENNHVIMSSAWPDDEYLSSIQFSTDIKRVEVPEDDNGRSVMSIPASVSLHIGVLLDGTDEVQSLGAATVLILGKDQSLELCIPVEANTTKQKYSPKTLFNKEMNPLKHTFGVTAWTMLKIKLVVVAKPTDDMPSIRSSADIQNPNTNSLTLFDKKTVPKTHLRQLRINTNSQVSSLKTTVSLLKTTTKLQVTALRSSLYARKSRPSQASRVAEPKLYSLPELTVLAPTSDINTDQYGDTEIVLNSSTLPAAAPFIAKYDTAPTDDDQSSVFKIESVPGESFDASSACSIATEIHGSKVKNSDNKSESTQDTHSSSDKSSESSSSDKSSFSDIVITASRVTFEESKGDALTGLYPLQEGAPAQENPFSKDVTTQLDEIVRVYSMRVNAQKSRAVASVSDNKQHDNAFTPQLEESSVTSTDLLLAQTKSQVAALKTKATIALNARERNSKQRVTAFMRLRGDQPVLNTIQETPINNNACSYASEDVQSVILMHTNKTGAEYSVEVSVDGGQSKSKEAESFTVIQKQGGSCERSQQMSTTPVSGPVRSYEDAYIILNPTMSSVGDLTVDTALESATLPSVISDPSVISKPIKVARNKRHPQRKEAAAFLQRITLCGKKYGVEEIVDDAWEGWRDIVIGDGFDLCDGVFEESDDESDICTLNTLESAQPKPSFRRQQEVGESNVVPLMISL